MRVVVSDPAVELIDERGGRLYVWVKKDRCCSGGVTRLVSASAPPPGKEFRRVEGCDRFELYLPRLARLPDELQVEVRRFPRRVEAYWDGCAWVA